MHGRVFETDDKPWGFLFSEILNKSIFCEFIDKRKCTQRFSKIAFIWVVRYALSHLMTSNFEKRYERSCEINFPESFKRWLSVWHGVFCTTSSRDYFPWKKFHTFSTSGTRFHRFLPKASFKGTGPASLSKSTTDLPSQKESGGHVWGSIVPNLFYLESTFPLGPAKYPPPLWHHVCLSQSNSCYRSLPKRTNISQCFTTVAR